MESKDLCFSSSLRRGHGWGGGWVKNLNLLFQEKPPRAAVTGSLSWEQPPSPLFPTEGVHLSPPLSPPPSSFLAMHRPRLQPWSGTPGRTLPEQTFTCNNLVYLEIVTIRSKLADAHCVRASALQGLMHSILKTI